MKQQHSRNSVAWRRYALASIGVLLILSLGIYLVSRPEEPPAFASERPIIPTQTHNHSTHAHLGHIPEEGRFTSQGEQWPPQPKFAQDVALRDPAATGRSAHVDREVTAADAVLNDAAVLDIVGDRYTFINSAAQVTKWKTDVSQFLVTLFSYTHNLTVEVLVENNAVLDITTYAAEVKQPPLRQNEVDQSIDIARAYWLAEGHDEVETLQGFTIQTFPTDGDDVAFFETRMTYVSFHVDSTQAPLLLTWVDLSAEKVTQSVIEGVER
ncbi:MAG: hypothetical protein ACPG8W_18740 [Candidatus Promineifilaceae bacterium]